MKSEAKPGQVGISPETWGPTVWALMHTFAEVADRHDGSAEAKLFFAALRSNLPCRKCREAYDRHTAAVRMGALAGTPSADEIDALDVYACAIGLAFQIVDDVLDVESTSEALGKTAGKDAEQGKPTYVSMIGIDAAKDWAARLRAEALQALAPFGDRARRLRELADFIVLRKR